MKKRILIMLCIVFILIIGLILILNIKDKNIDFDGLRNELLNEYNDLHEYNQFETFTQFGIDTSILSESLFMSDYTFSSDSTMFDPSTLIIVIKSKDAKHYYDILDGFIYTYTNNVDNNPKLDLFKNAIIKRKKNLVYLILSNDNKYIEDVLNKYL